MLLICFCHFFFFFGKFIEPSLSPYKFNWMIRAAGTWNIDRVGVCLRLFTFLLFLLLNTEFFCLFINGLNHFVISFFFFIFSQKLIVAKQVKLIMFCDFILQFMNHLIFSLRKHILKLLHNRNFPKFCFHQLTKT